MYEPLHAKLVAAVLAHRIAPGGAALLCCPVRQAATFATFEAECVKRGLRYRRCQVRGNPPSSPFDLNLACDLCSEGCITRLCVLRRTLISPLPTQRAHECSLL